MKLVTYASNGTTRLGALHDAMVIDILQAIKAYLGGTGKGGTVGSDFPSDMLSFLQGGDQTKKSVEEAVDWVIVHEKDEFTLPLSQVILRAPIMNPSKVIGIGLNYADHCREQNIPLPESVLILAKFPSSIIGPEENITWGSGMSQEVDYEAELGVIMGREAFKINPQDAWDYVGGYTIINDVSARDVQFADGQWVRGKSFDTFCPMGPYMATPDEIQDPNNLNIKTRLNDTVVQDSNTSEMVFKIPEIISFISKSITLMPGDVISTGTPDGVGYFHDPKLLLKPGDVIEIEIDGLGLLRNPVV
jgi:2-keto-4-pentenoate hydratase/2-oxohepta-3-ene-1,7-dioic acid hydratase in catechol pathway